MSSQKANWKEGVGLQIVQALLTIMERNLELPGRGAGPAARAAAASEALTRVQLTRGQAACYTFGKLSKVLAKMTLKVTRGRPTGNPQFSEEEQRAYDLYQAQNSAALSSSSSESDESPPSPYQPQYGYGNSGYSPYHDGALACGK
eukprot:g2941.t1